ncbi:AAA family ATPase [Methanococcus voltae]|uniref:Cobyrinic acid ac-diamide synthase n=1 Tax=Methanococcus voltae (strain ATCC BAA-1334 / A3) TaxID=456320 RepID=D7DV98_METV3|nr:AAA family ATPase [Methanococcus voltae]MCS3901899.1 cobyric acid synthase [Methanococcus voltae]
MEIGLLSVKNTLPFFENFGNLPTKLISESNIKDINDLDFFIIPGGSLIECNDLLNNNEFTSTMSNYQGYILGICSGFQLLSYNIDIGRKSQTPILKKGLGLLDVNIAPLICTDRVNFKIEDKTLFNTLYKSDKNNNVLKNNYNKLYEGFHCHTYGHITPENSKVFTKSIVNKLNYKMLETSNELISGAYDGKIYGTMIHNFLDNKNIKESLLSKFKIKEDELKEITDKNQKIKLNSKKYRFNGKTDINKIDNIKKAKKGIILLGTGSESGKTFITTSIAGKLAEKGYKVFSAKIGPDVRDIVPSLYITNETMTKYNSIKIYDRGWSTISEFKKYIETSDYDYYIIEGVMGAFTGCLNKAGYSSAEIAKFLNIPTYVVSSCSKSGIEGAYIESLIYYKLLEKIGADVKGIILNKTYNDRIAEKVKKIGDLSDIDIIPIKKAKQNINIKNRGLMPEIEIDYDLFCKLALELDINMDLFNMTINNKNNLNDEIIQKYFENSDDTTYLEQKIQELSQSLKII